MEYTTQQEDMNMKGKGFSTRAQLRLFARRNARAQGRLRSLLNERRMKASANVARKAHKARRMSQIIA